jgi:hypothetical protein
MEEVWRESAQDERMDNKKALRELRTRRRGYVGEKEEDEEEDEGDIIDGCCVLDFDIAGLKTSIRVRARYILIFDHIAKLFDEVVYPG